MSFDPRRPSSLGIVGKAERKLRSIVRRMRVIASSGGLWRMGGYEIEVDDDDVPLFGGIGFHSRPSSSGEPEAVIVKIGASEDHAVIVATRDESVRVDVDEDETVIFNSVSMVKIKADGTIEIGDRSGSPVALALKSDVTEIWDYLGNQFNPAAGHTHVGAGLPVNVDTTGSATGTSKLKGE